MKSQTWLALLSSGLLVFSAAAESLPHAWPVSAPEAQGLSSEKLERMRTNLVAHRTKALLVIRNDHIVCEWYAPGVTAETKQGTASLAKGAVGGLSVAVALSDGKLSLDDPASRFIPEWRADARKNRITLRQLGSHTSGLADAESNGVPHLQLIGWPGDFWKQLPVPNDPFTISRDLVPLVSDPGQEMHYSNPGIAMLNYATTAALREAPLKDIRTLLRERVMKPIGVESAEWSIGYGKTFTVQRLPLVAAWGGASFTPRALARVGRLMLREGDWDGKRLISAEAVRAVTRDAGTPGNGGIGWWTNTEGEDSQLPKDAFWASGAGHQILFVVPSLNLIAVRNGELLGPTASEPGKYHALVKELLFHPLVDSRLKPTGPEAPEKTSAAAAPQFTAYSPGEANVVVSSAGDDFLRLGTAVWGPKWSWASVSGRATNDHGTARGLLGTKLGGEWLKLAFEAGQPSAQTLELAYELSAEKEAELTLFAVEVVAAKRLNGRSLLVEDGGKVTKRTLPLGRGTLGERVSKLTIDDAASGTTTIQLDPPCEVATDGALRILLAKERLPAGKPSRLKLTVALPAAAQWYPTSAQIPEEPGIENWYTWQASGNATNSVLDMTGWIERPAGKHGRIKSQGERLMYNGQPLKLWGINVCYGACAPDKALADKRAAFYPRYGINTVRLHKFADGAGWNGIQSKESSAEFDAAALDRFDYQVAKLKEAGIYVKLSSRFGTISMGPTDVRDVPFLNEFGSFDDGKKDRVSAPHSAFFYSHELQNVHIRQAVNLLKHKNPYTGLTYAEEPAVCALEIINEQSILFFTSMQPLKQSATLRKQVGERFSDWLKKKYGSHDGLVKAWGPSGLNGFEKDGFAGNEHLDRRNILPLGNPWYWDPAQINGPQSARKRRMLDTLEFLYELQCEAYDRYVKAVRAAGYDGEILGSNWQAGRAYSHYANLHSDARVGLIDRHNYFGGGGRGGRGKFNNASMLARAGSGSLSSGLQQVEERPFMLSEWIHVFPNEWGVEGPALIGAYGMGLQGWDVSYLFENTDSATFSKQLGGSEWDAMAPQILSIFPAVSRQVLRGDVSESDAVAVRNVHVPSLFGGKLGFDDTVVQGYDDKELDTSKVSARALAAARCTVNFTPEWKETPTFDLSKYMRGDVIESSTKQLRWTESTGRKTGGFITINTAGTKAVVGFAQNQACDLGGVTITPQSRFAATYVTALDKNGSITNARQLLISAVARARNTGMKFSLAGDELLERGKGPILMEPVRAEFRFARAGTWRLQALDQDGRPTGKVSPIKGGAFAIDSGRDKTAYYLIERE